MWRKQKKNVVLENNIWGAVCSSNTYKEELLMSDNTKGTTGGITFGGLLTVVFIALKLTDVIYWSWWWVISPIWLPLALALVVAFIIFIITLLSEI